MLRIRPILKVFIIAIVFSQSAYGGPVSPLRKLKDSMDSIVATLNDPKYRLHQSTDEERKKITDIVHSIFDFEEMSLRTMQKQYNKFTSGQKKDFQNIYEQFLTEIFIHKIQGEHEKFKITYLKQYISNNIRALIKTKITREDDEIPINFRLKRIRGDWKIYDISIDNENLVATYRKKFDRFIAHESPDELIKAIYMQLEKIKKSMT